MSVNNELPNNPQETKPAKPANLAYDVPKEGWGLIPIGIALALLLPAGVWAWPYIPEEWRLSDESLIKAAIGIAVIAFGIKLNTWLKNKSEGAVDSHSMEGGGGGPTSQSTTTIPQLKSIQSKPLAKSHNMSYGGGKGVAKEVGQYRHEKMGDGEADKMTLKGWGGNEGGGGSVDAAGRAVQKKPVRR
jgi:hypothetical protein